MKTSSMQLKILTSNMSNIEQNQPQGFLNEIGVVVSGVSTPKKKNKLFSFFKGRTKHQSCEKERDSTSNTLPSTAENSKMIKQFNEKKLAASNSKKEFMININGDVDDDKKEVVDRTTMCCPNCSYSFSVKELGVILERLNKNKTLECEIEINRNLFTSELEGFGDEDYNGDMKETDEYGGSVTCARTDIRLCSSVEKRFSLSEVKKRMMESQYHSLRESIKILKEKLNDHIASINNLKLIQEKTESYVKTIEERIKFLEIENKKLNQIINQSVPLSTVNLGATILDLQKERELINIRNLNRLVQAKFLIET